jgi:hypothetical protein
MPTKFEAHTTYKDTNGVRVPSVTTILGVLAKPQLINWAYKLGKDGQDMKAVQDSAMSTGTLLHYLIATELRGEKPDQEYLDEFTLRDQRYCNNCLLSWDEWKKDKVIEIVECEKPMVSQKFGYGGTLDLLAYINGKLCLCDFKSSNGIYIDYWYQLAAYGNLVEENVETPLIEQYHILRFGKDMNNDFEDKFLTDLDNHWQVFHHCLQVYKLQNSMRRGER